MHPPEGDASRLSLAHHTVRQIERLRAAPGASSRSPICHVAASEDQDHNRHDEHDQHPRCPRKVGPLARRTQLLAELHERGRHIPPHHTRAEDATTPARTGSPADDPRLLQMGAPGAQGNSGRGPA